MRFHVDDDIRRAETLPAEAFTSQQFLDAELSSIYQRSWLVVPERGDDPRPLDEQLAPRGSRVPITVMNRPLFLQRGWDDDELRAFPNTCTHAWFPLVLGASRGPTLVCGQHGRRFDCTGKFVSQQGFGGVPDFPRACDHLQQLPVAHWRRLTWVAMNAETPPACCATSMTRSRGCPSCPSACPRRSATSPATGSSTRGTSSTRSTSGSSIARRTGSPMRSISAATRPSLSVNVYQPDPERPDRTKFIWYQYALDRELHAQRDRRWLSAQVDAEDVDALAQVARGLRSGFAQRGRFAPEHEMAAHWFHRKVSRAVSATLS